MFGQNPVRHQELGDGMKLTVQEVFYTIQGEGPYAGQTAVFVRLWGCNLRCKFCDTDFESNESLWATQDLMDHVQALAGEHCDLIVITGGEPLRQNLLPFCRMAHRLGFTVQIETSGSIWIPGLEETGADIVVSPKTPVMNRDVEKWAHCFKYVVKAGEMDEHGFPTTNPQTGKPMVAPRPADPAAQIYLQPMDEGDPAKNRANMIAARDACLKHGYRISLQQHKILEVA